MTPNREAYDELVIIRDIPVRSLCAHDGLRCIGVAHVGYVPDERILGLSKLAHVVDDFARDLQLQERLTSQVSAWLEDHLQPKGIGIVIRAEHLCTTVRGVQAPATCTVTMSLRGVVREDARKRQEFLALARG